MLTTEREGYFGLICHALCRREASILPALAHFGGISGAPLHFLDSFHPVVALLILLKAKQSKNSLIKTMQKLNHSASAKELREALEPQAEYHFSMLSHK